MSTCAAKEPQAGAELASDSPESRCSTKVDRANGEKSSIAQSGSSHSKSDKGSPCGANADSNHDKVDTSPVQKPNSIRKPSASTASKFKEKRPEPLKLNPNLNQDIPLDLSVKSAGNVPSGTMSSIFNLGPTNYLTTLETPRIQWQDNDALLAAGKARLSSSSTNTSQRARISSLLGESPPITPNATPIEGMLSSSGTNLRLSNNMPHSASLVLGSHSTFEPRKTQILERWAQTNRSQVAHLKVDQTNGPKRSCSSDNLDLKPVEDKHSVRDDKQEGNRLGMELDETARVAACGPVHNAKKNAISPLAIKSLSSSHNEEGHQNKFSYSNQQIASNLQDSQRSPTASSVNGKSLTPTSVANATANLLNIHLNSPTGLSQSPVSSTFDVGSVNGHNHSLSHKTPSFMSFEQEFSPSDPYISSTMCQQQSNGSRNSSVNFSSPTLNSDANNNYQRNMIAFQQQNLSSISSSATLNTPTLISPSQLKAGSLCFMQSPTLSPLSSVFDLPSPFLMFSQNHHQTVASNKQPLSKSTGPIQNEKSQNGTHARDPGLQGGSRANEAISKSCETLQSDSCSRNNHLNNVASAHDLSQLITPGIEKVLATLPITKDETEGNTGEDVDMDIDCDLSTDPPMESCDTARKSMRSPEARPATTIPQICVSDHQLEAAGSEGPTKAMKRHIEEAGGRLHRDSLSKRSLSPKSFCSQVNNYRNERLGSSSAPPEVHHQSRQAKIKTITAHSGHDISRDCNVVGVVSGEQGAASKTAERHRNNPMRSQLLTSNRHARQARPYPEVRDWFPPAGQLLQTQTYTNGSSGTLGIRSTSAEPVVCSGPLAKRTGQYSSSVANPNNSTLNCCQPATQFNNASALSNSAQQLHYNSHSGTSRWQGFNSFGQTTAAGQNRPNTSASNSNQQLHQQYATQQPHYQQQQQNHSQHSVSAVELNRIPATSIERRLPIMNMSSYIGGIRSDIGHFASSQASQHGIVRSAQAINNQQAISSSSLNRVDHLLTDYQNQVHAEQGRQQHPNSMVCADSPATNSRGSTVNLLCGDETCQRQMNHSNQVQLGTATKGPHPMQHQLQQQRGLIACEMPTNLPGIMSNNINSLACSYQIDIEGRPDSRSNSSLDFPSHFMEAALRPHSEAGSTMTSKKYHCDLCSKSFTRSDMLTRHKRLHSGDRPFQCGECKQEFSRSDHLSTHMRTHTGEKPYKCKLCSYSACRKDMITRHLKVHSRSAQSNDCI